MGPFQNTLRPLGVPSWLGACICVQQLFIRCKTRRMASLLQCLVCRGTHPFPCFHFCSDIFWTVIKQAFF